MANYRFEELSPNNKKDWEEFNKKNDGGSFFHTLKWKDVIEDSFDYKLHYFLIYYEDKVVAICPFCENNIGRFRGLMPPPNSEYRQLLINKKDYKQLLIKEILNKTKEISKNKKLSFVLINTLSEEIKGYFDKYNPYQYPIFGKSGHSILNLKENNPEKIWHDIFTKRGKGKPRQYIRKFEKDEIKIREAKSISDLKEFYRYYKANLEYKNIKPYSFSFFEKIWNAFSSTDVRITLLTKDEQVFGGLLAFLYPPKKTMYLRHLAINREIPGRYHPTYPLAWDAVVNAAGRNYDTVCFGQTPNDPNDASFRIKMKFGCSYENEYSLIFPLSPLFKTGYNIYKYINFTKIWRQKN